MSDMNEHNSHSASATLDEQIAHLTEWPAEAEPQVWQGALHVVKNRNGESRNIGMRLLSWPIPKSVAAVLVLGLTGVALALLASSFNAERPGRSVAVSLPQQAAQIEFPWQKDRQFATVVGEGKPVYRYGGTGDLNGSADSWRQSAAGGSAGPARDGNLHSAMVMQNYYAPEATDGAMARGAIEQTPIQTGNVTAIDTDRAVVRKAQMELLTDDVRGAFLKAQHLVSEATGEYVQDSALLGTEKDKNLQANLTLRVTAERLSAVLNDLRALGNVNAESSGGEDVTATMVDLEARLGNEKRVEKELLDLMEKRTDAPLKEILELRDKISQIRQAIEQMTAQRERLGRLVSLATILLIIRTEPEQPKPQTQPAKTTIGQYFGESVGHAWSNGLLVLADTVAGMLKVIVGGIIWWAALIVGIIALRQHLRRRMMVAATRA